MSDECNTKLCMTKYSYKSSFFLIPVLSYDAQMSRQKQFCFFDSLRPCKAGLRNVQILGLILNQTNTKVAFFFIKYFCLHSYLFILKKCGKNLFCDRLIYIINFNATDVYAWLFLFTCLRVVSSLAVSSSTKC